MSTANFVPEPLIEWILKNGIKGLKAEKVSRQPQRISIKNDAQTEVASISTRGEYASFIRIWSFAAYKAVMLAVAEYEKAFSETSNYVRCTFDSTSIPSRDLIDVNMAREASKKPAIEYGIPSFGEWLLLIAYFGDYQTKYDLPSESTLTYQGSSLVAEVSLGRHMYIYSAKSYHDLMSKVTLYESLFPGIQVIVHAAFSKDKIP